MPAHLLHLAALALFIFGAAICVVSDSTSLQHILAFGFAGLACMAAAELAPLLDKAP